jgi:peptidyl-prolyl cis-trans isomerase B (cyclophilin B)
VTKKQERARQRRRYQKQQAKAARREAQNQQLKRVGALAAAVTVLVIVLVAAWATLKPDTKSTTAASSSSSAAQNAAGCEAPPQSLGTGSKLTLPDKAEAEGKTFEATLTTNCGDIVVELDGARAPQAVASFIQLARADYWLNSPCHRLVRSEPMTVLQCGDPTGTGQGDPGYGFAVENAPADGKYERGTLAMARTQDPEKGNGGQFFIVGAPTSIPDPNGYTVFGKVVQGLDIVDRVVAEGVAGGSSSDGAPSAPISILRVAVTEKKA